MFLPNTNRYFLAFPFRIPLFEKYYMNSQGISVGTLEGGIELQSGI
jgi:hypothetical protein